MGKGEFNEKYNFFLIPFTFFNCKSYVFLKDVPDQSAQTDKRIALIGFFPQKTSSAGYRERITYLDFSKSKKEFFSTGKPIESFPAAGFTSKADSKKLEKVYTKYLSEVKATGKVEIEKVIIFDSKKKEYLLKDSQADYYVIGYLGKAFSYTDYNNFVWAFLSQFTTLTSVFTLGTFPVIDVRKVNAKYALYDSEMNRIEEIDRGDSFVVIRAWWVSENCSVCSVENPDTVYENDIRKAEKQILKIISSH